MKKITNNYIPLMIITLITVFSLVPYANAMSGKPDPPGSCRGYTLCTSLEGKDFDMIKFASMGSELIILYDKNKSGEISPTSMASLYDRSSGTVNDAIFYLSQNPDYDRFIIRKARKSTGWFKSEDIDSVYLVLPKYKQGPADTPEYSFFDKNGKLSVRIRPIVRTHISGDD